MWEPNEATTEALGNVPQLLQAARQPCFLILTGPDKGAVHPLSAGPRVLGRSASHADIVIAGRGLSRSHARVELVDDRQVQVQDLESTNGIFLNGAKVAEATMNDGDILALGPEVQVRLEFPDPTVQQLIQEMHKGATRDALTGVLNRRAFMQRLQQEHCATSRHKLHLSLVILDVDHFKSVNDTYGHMAGDAVLVELARRLSESVRTEDVVGRYGGEEFVLMMRQTPVEGALVLMDRLRETICGSKFRVPTTDGYRDLAVTFSAGLTTVDGVQPLEAALAAADEALYRAKKAGRNRVFQADPPS